MDAGKLFHISADDDRPELTFQLHGYITHLSTVRAIVHFNIWSFMTPKALQKILCFKAEAASLLCSQITDEYGYSK